MTDHIKYEIHGVPEAIRGIDRVHDRTVGRAKDFVQRLGEVAETWMRLYAPIGDTGYLQRHIYRTSPRWRPGGFGGGGEWEVITGVRRGTSEHPIWVHEGTGEYGFRRRPITPSSNRTAASVLEKRSPRSRFQDFHGAEIPAGRAPALTFQKRGEPRRFRPYVRGQHPQPYVKAAYHQTQIYAVTHFYGLNQRNF